MARPESISDIELDPIEFATMRIDAIAANGALVKAYGTFMEAVQKAGAEVEIRYNGATFIRPPTDQEQMEQLKSNQASWDEGKKQYEILASVGECEYAYQRGQAENWARAEGMPFPPAHEPISTFDAVIRGIDEVTA